MQIKAKWVGSGVTNLTTNNDYDVVFLIGSSAVVVDDNGALFDSGNPIIGTFPWQVISISTVGAVDLFP